MRIINKSSSTKPERIFIEILKKHHIPFLWRHKVKGHEIDFLIGKLAIEIDGHSQSAQRNAMLVAEGYVPIHYHNNALMKNREQVEKHIVELTK